MDWNNLDANAWFEIRIMVFFACIPLSILFVCVCIAYCQWVWAKYPEK